jgi:hypothetical protein
LYYCTVWKIRGSSSRHHFVEEVALKDGAVLVVDLASTVFLALGPFNYVFLTCFQVFQLAQSVSLALMPLAAVDLFSRGRYMSAVSLRFPLVKAPLINRAAMLVNGHADPLCLHLSGIPGTRIKCLIGPYLQILVLHLVNVSWQLHLQVVKWRPLSELTFHPGIVVFCVTRLHLVLHGLLELLLHLIHVQHVFIDLVPLIHSIKILSGRHLLYLDLPLWRLYVSE